MHFIWALIVGLIVGAIAKALMPGRDPGGIRRMKDTMRRLARDADLLIHDAMHADTDYDQRRGWGHSPARAGVAVAERANVKRLALFHHSPDATDEMIDEVVARTASRTAVPVFAAAEGSYLDV